MATDTLRIMIIGAHPDDPDWYAGGTVALYTQQGHHVRMVALTNGDAGHQEIGGAPLARRRRAEAIAAGERLGAEYLVLDNHDGALLPTLEVRYQVIRVIREFRPDLVMTHRPYDYHPDHRYTGQVVQDAITQTTLSSTVAYVPPLPTRPVVVYLWDQFQKPYPFIPDVAVDVDDVMDKKLDALSCHVSQMFESLGNPPASHPGATGDLVERRLWLQDHLDPEFTNIANLYRNRLVELYGEERGRQVKYAEAFEACEYGSPLSEANVRRLFPFF